MNLRVFFFLVIIMPKLLIANEVLLGTGMSSETQGRIVPTIHTGYKYDEVAITVNSMGVQNEVYYHVAYSFSYFKSYDFGEFMWSTLNAGPGISVFYQEFGYRDDTDDDGESESDLNLALSFRVEYPLFEHAFVAVEGMFGVGSLMMLFNTYQTTQFFVFGVNF